MKSVAFIAAVALAGCATSPSKIEAAYVSPLKYRNLSCDEVAIEQAAVETKAAALHKRLKRKADTDTFEMTAGLVLVWPMLFFLEGGDGPEATEYAQLKGERDALATAARSCNTTVASRTVSGRTVRVGADGNIISGVALLPAKTASGFCVLAPPGYVGTGSLSSPVITSGQPRCEAIRTESAATP